MTQNIIDIMLVFCNIAETACLIYLIRRFNVLEKNQQYMQHALQAKESAEKNIQNDLEKRLFEIQNVRYSRSYANVLNAKGKGK